MKTIKKFNNVEISKAFSSKVFGGGDEATATNPSGADPNVINGNTVTVTATTTVPLVGTVVLGTATFTFSDCKSGANGSITCIATTKK